MRNKAFGLLLSFLLLCGIPLQAQAASVSDFADVKPGVWYYPAVDYAAKNNLFQGTTATTFSPGTQMSRAMFVTVLGRHAKIPATYTSNKTKFSDTSQGQYYFPYACWANDTGIVTGIGNNQFAPNNSITREQMAVMLFRYAMKSGYSTAYSDSKYLLFSDTNKVSAYAVNALKWATYHSIIEGSNGRLDPQSNATRAQVAQILLNFSKSKTGNSEPDTQVPAPTTSPAPGTSQETRLTGRSKTDAQGGYIDYDLSNAVMDLINNLRKENGLSALAYHTKLQEWAGVRAEESSESFSHTRPDGSSYTTVGTSINGENLAMAPSSSNAETFLNMWYNSEGHRENMLRAQFQLGAISCYVKDGYIYVSHLFSVKSFAQF